MRLFEVDKTMRPFDCSVVVPNYNGLKWLPELLTSLTEQSTLNLEILIVDNGSTDGSQTAISSRARLIPLDQNYGFAFAVNRGIESAQSSLIFLVNNDVVLEQDALVRLVRFLETHPEYDFVQPKMKFLHDKTKINNAGDVWSIWGTALQRGFGESDMGQYDSIQEIFAPTGGAVLYRKSVFDRIGLFDERFFAYIEDVDVGFRIRLKGMKGVLFPESVVYHGFQSTTRTITDFSRFYVMRNSQFAAIKNLPAWLMIKYWPQMTFGHIRNWLIGVKDRRFGLIIRVYASVIRNLPYLLSERRRIQKSRQIAVREIDGWLEKSCPFGARSRA